MAATPFSLNNRNAKFCASLANGTGHLKNAASTTATLRGANCFHKETVVANAGTSDGAKKGWEARRGEIASSRLGLSTLSTRKMDDLDFSDQHVNGLKKALQDAHRHGSGGTDASDSELESLAHKTLGHSLVEKKSDGEDFKDTAVWMVKKAMDAAHEHGKASKASHTDDDRSNAISKRAKEKAGIKNSGTEYSK